MTSTYGYIQSYDYRQMYDIQDLRSTKPNTTYPDWSLSKILQDSPQFSIYFYILKLSKLDILYGDIQGNFTLFVPDDRNLIQKYGKKNLDNLLKNMNLYTARQIILCSSLDKQLFEPFIRSTNVMYLYTRVTNSKLNIENYSDCTIINGNIKVKCWDIKANNGVIQTTDDIIMPEYMAIQYVD